MRILAALCAGALASSCGLRDAPEFGARCDAADACARPLQCDLTSRRCLPPVPPDPRGVSCEEALPLAIAPRGTLVGGTLEGVLATANSTEVDGGCAAGRALDVSVVVPQTFGDDGASRPAVVLSVDVIADAAVALEARGAACANVFEHACLPAPAVGSATLTLPWVEPGELHLVLTFAPGTPPDTAFTLRVDQVECPAGFLPDSEGCLGFARVRGPRGRVDHTVTAVPGGRAIVVGGADEDGGPLPDAHRFDAFSRSFKAIAPLSTHKNHGAAALPDGSVLIVGGRTVAPSLELFNAGTERFERPGVIDQFSGAILDATAIGMAGPIAALWAGPGNLASVLPRGINSLGSPCNSTIQCGRPDLECVLLADPFGPAADGICVCSESGCLGDALAFTDPVFLGTSSALNHWGRGAVVALGFTPFPSLAFFFGGVFDSLPLDGIETAEPFEPVAFESSRDEVLTLHPSITALPHRLDPKLVSRGTVLTVIGGRTLAEAPIADILSFDPLAPVPTIRTAVLAVPRADHVLIRLDDSRVIVAGGVDDAGDLLASTEILDLATLELRAGPQMPTPRSRAEAARLDDGTSLVAGGVGPDGHHRDSLLLMRVAPTLDAPTFGVEPTPAVGGETCADALRLEGPGGTISSDTAAASADLSATALGDCTGYPSSGRDLVFGVDVPANATLTATAEPATFTDISLFLVAACDPQQPDVCLAGSDVAYEGGFETISWTNPGATREVFVVVDAFADGQGCPFSLIWEIE